MVKVKQDLLNSIKEFTLMDDPFMTKVFEDDIERTQLILRIILENDTIKVKKASTQKRLKNLQGRDLQLDILAEKADGTKFNVEVQNESSGAIPQRARYHIACWMRKACRRVNILTKSLRTMLFSLQGKMFLKDCCQSIIFIEQ